MTTFNVGIIAAPGFPERLSNKVIEELPTILNRELNTDAEWDFHVAVDPLIGSAEDVNKSLDAAQNVKQEHNWDYGIVVTDLPIVSNRRVIIGNLDETHATALISLPALGWIGLRKKLKQSLLYFAESIYRSQHDDEANQQHKLNLSWITRIKPETASLDQKQDNDMETATEQEDGDETSKSHTTTRFILKPLIISWIFLLFGMTRANEPWKEIPNFKKIISLSFATATYLTIFSTPWQMSIEFSNLRFILMTILAVGGMALWIMYAHRLWEPPSSLTTRTYRTVYNITTVMTLLIIIALSYVILFVLLMVSVALFVPNDLYNMMTSNQGIRTWGQFLYLTWFITSLGFLAGALGASVENEEKIRDMTYSYRQRARYREAKEWESSKYYSSDSEKNIKEQKGG
ncbi:Uncharacterised protein [Staphylococcus piscifermentans]|uniref:5,10-methylene-tetrahydrofolate dehydrogenase n=1 Tax=Staphylococcus piscifermentans TaxID=70258 RepID=A0A239TKC4_9STAP|nr:hypothetical protein [Staphylococcus piscifermentans]RTX83242.1 hypothetical protein CD139_09555 [Staphylococcus piscifermentans]GEP85199.1 hypothetical protein SPI02_17840 [Staphylococcus piscifermentans]SNU98025.1 Uncharacterised protein [Staphylococcus piscifermentans]